MFKIACFFWKTSIKSVFPFESLDVYKNRTFQKRWWACAKSHALATNNSWSCLMWTQSLTKLLTDNRAASVVIQDTAGIPAEGSILSVLHPMSAEQNKPELWQKPSVSWAAVTVTLPRQWYEVVTPLHCWFVGFFLGGVVSVFGVLGYFLVVFFPVAVSWKKPS